MPFLGNNTSMPIQGSLSNMILAALLEVTVNGCLSHLTFLYLPWEPVLRKDCRIHFKNLPVYVAEELNIQLLHIYISVPALGGAWKVE